MVGPSSTGRSIVCDEIVDGDVAAADGGGY